MRFICVDHDGGPISLPELGILMDMACYMYRNRQHCATTRSPDFTGMVETEFQTVFFVNLQGIQFEARYTCNGRDKWAKFIVREGTLKHREFCDEGIVGKIYTAVESGRAGADHRRREPSMN